MRRLTLSLILAFLYVGMNAQQDPWAVYMTPSDTHSFLGRYAGTFKMEMTMAMGEGPKPTIIVLDSEHRMLLGGRFLEMRQHGSIMGMDYQAIMTLGYNNTDKKMALTTITNLGTGTLSLSGEWNAKSRSAVLLGQLTNPVNKKPVNIKQVVSFLDQDTILIESYDHEGDAPERKTAQYKLIRNKL